MWSSRLISLLGLVSTVSAISCVSVLPTAPSPMLNKTVHLELLGMGDEKIAIPTAEAKATVLEFWSPTCEPCKERVPAVVARETELRNKGAELVLVAVLSGDESMHDAEAALASWGVRGLRPVLERGNALQTQIGVNALPATAILQGDKLVWIAPAEATAGDVVNAVP